ncbi:alpha-ketoacid dehydrogenase subunit beta [Agrobacterium sp. OT33]|uniref:alpha-ketoacid dehydrogenase subunit beta n=1 Tax=Agrobacterium sp. OT33 TaxID=2815338 RepID=UPI001A8D1280|nr:alpha-ketoacid dehydrogenase subunit beta [Agrobacterium sp. OT33]MBO0128515.1 alpha-ketoacid dehydrogenase subunit beta [Agrobacterium sp. OT33]
MAETRYVKAVTRALQDSMAADSRVILIGEDIAAAGGSFKATRGLLEEFGAARVYDAPIAEAAITGIAVGAALSGLKPVAEIMFMDFVTLSMDMMVNQAAKARYMFGAQGSVSMALRTPHGGGLSAGPQHSQCLEAWFAHIPGLKVVVPATVEDAYSLLRAAIDDPDPVVVVENKSLYALKGELPDAPAPARIGEGAIRKPGTDATLVAYGAMVWTALSAAETLEKDGISVEVIDLRSIQPWDEALVLSSLKRTHRLAIVHEAVEAFGVGAEIAARMAHVGFDELDAPILRVAAPFSPVPFSPALENAWRPTEEKIITAVRQLLA